MPGPEVDLSHVSASALLAEVSSRSHEELFEGPFLTSEAFALADKIATRVCVDGAAVRRNAQDEIELLAIRRNSGQYAGKLTLVGGGVGLVQKDGEWVPESLEQALRRHYKVDLGFDIEPVTSWNEPQYVAQDMRPVDGEVLANFTPNPASRHLVAIRYLVGITNELDTPTYGSTRHGGQEAAGINWFTEQAMPDPSEFGYGHGATYELMFQAANRLLAAPEIS